MKNFFLGKCNKSGMTVDEQCYKQLAEYSDTELRQLNQRIVSILKSRSQKRLAEAMSEFSVGDHVSFDYYGITYFGEVTHLNRKTVGVKTENGEDWNISPAGLNNLG